MVARTLTTDDINVPGGIAGLDDTAAISLVIQGIIDSAKLHGVPLSNVIAALTAQNRVSDAIQKSRVDI